MPDRRRLIDDALEWCEFPEIRLQRLLPPVWHWLFSLWFKSPLNAVTGIVGDGVAVAVCDACAKLNWLLKWLITFHALLWLDVGVDDDDGDGNDDINGKRNKKLIVEAVVVVVLNCFECCCRCDGAVVALTELIGLISCLYWINERRMHEDWRLKQKLNRTEQKGKEEKRNKERKKARLKLKRTEKSIEMNTVYATQSF